MAKTPKIRINLAEYDIVFLVLSKLITANPKMTLNEIQCCLLDEHAQGDELNDHQQTLKKVKWKHFLWGHLKPNERVKGDDLQTVEGQLICVAETLDPLQHFIESFGEKAVAGDFEFENKKLQSPKTARKTSGKKGVTTRSSVSKKGPAKTAVSKRTGVKKTAAKKAAVKKLPAKKTETKKVEARKTASKKKAPAKKTGVKKPPAKKATKKKK